MVTLHHIHNWAGIALVLFLLLVFPLTGLRHMFRPVRINGLNLIPPSNRISSANYVPPAHVHQIDIDRSPFTVTPQGAIYARCCMQGCETGVYISRNISQALWKGRP